MKSIRGGMGLGDALYVQSVARHLIEKGESLRIHSAWPEVFKQLGPRALVAPFSRNVQILAHYAPRKGAQGTTQFQDVCLQAGIRSPIDLRLDWKAEDSGLLESLKSRGRPILCVQLPRAPMGRKDGFGAELLPDCKVIQRLIDRLKEKALIVQVGSGLPLHRFDGIDVDLANRTTVSQLLDVASIAGGFLGYVSFLLPLAESFSRPALMVWSRNGLQSPALYIRQITPKKIIHKPSTRYVVDDASPEEIDEAADAFMR